MAKNNLLFFTLANHCFDGRNCRVAITRSTVVKFEESANDGYTLICLDSGRVIAVTEDFDTVADAIEEIDDEQRVSNS